VGADYVGGYRPFTERWDGLEWSIVPTPIINSSQYSYTQLYGVTCPTDSRCWAVGSYGFDAPASDPNYGKYLTLIEAFTPIPTLTNIVSRKIHNGPTFDLALPLNGSGVEPRSGGANGNYSVVFRFANALASVDAANVAAGTGSITSSSIGSDPHEYIVNLTGVTNAQRLTLALNNARDSAGDIGSVMSVTAGFLIGDTNGDGAVNSVDILQTKSRSGQALTSSNFRSDLNTDGGINSADISLVKSRSGTALP
jgi:hypothetical protein